MKIRILAALALVVIPSVALAQVAAAPAITWDFATIWGYASTVVAAAAAAAAVLPQGADGTIWGTIRKVLDFLAMNVFNAKNAPKK